jgi:hypothetical protein
MTRFLRRGSLAMSAASDFQEATHLAASSRTWGRERGGGG